MNVRQHLSSFRKLRTSSVITEDTFCRELPSPETAVDIFRGMWSSSLPPPHQTLTGGSADLFDDGRLKWANKIFDGITGMRVVELGPLEGGHTYMLDRLGALDVVSIEANKQAFLRCLVVKEILGIPSSHFLCGDFAEYLKSAVEHCSERWDLCLAVGVLYHQEDPVSLLELITKTSDRILLWTHYYDQNIVRLRSDLQAKFPSSETKTTAGFNHTLYRYEYGSALGWSGFCGGLASWSSWMTRDDILACLEFFNFDVLGIEFDHPDHANGPAFCVAARRR